MIQSTLVCRVKPSLPPPPVDTHSYNRFVGHLIGGFGTLDVNILTLKMVCIELPSLSMRNLRKITPLTGGALSGSHSCSQNFCNTHRCRKERLDKCWISPPKHAFKASSSAVALLSETNHAANSCAVTIPA